MNTNSMKDCLVIPTVTTDAFTQNETNVENKHSHNHITKFINEW